MRIHAAHTELTCRLTGELDTFNAHHNKAIRSVLLIYASYILAVFLAAFPLTLPIDGQYPRVGAMLILFPTFFTGLHLVWLSRVSGGLNYFLTETSRGSVCELCGDIHTRAGEGIAAINRKLNTVIICEVGLATLGTILWAFGDCVSPGCMT